MRPDTDETLLGAAHATAPTVFGAHGDAQELPRPAKPRWHPLRSGLLNLYRYDEQEFWFEQGRLLLRGNNGTGKSRVLALQLPFLLDGEIAPHRVEPDRDPAKRMEWNLLMNRHSDRLGYTWIEFGRLLPDGGERFLTLGCGLRAVHGRGIDDRWFFITPQRIGIDLVLVSEGRNPLSRERLEQAVGRERVYRQAREYRRAVDAALFKLGARYEPLIELLIRLRQPQLSRQLDESALSHALSEALAPLPIGLIEETAEAFRGLEADREELSAARLTHAGVQEFLGEYRRYIRAAARRRAEAVRGANAAFEAAARRVRDATQRRDEAAAGCAQLRRAINANEDSHVALQAAIRALEESPEMRGARELERSRQEAERCASTRTQAEHDARTARAAEQQAQQEHAEVCANAEDVARQSRAALTRATQLAAAAAFADPHAAAMALLSDLDTAPHQIDGARRALDTAVQRRLATMTHLSELQAALGRALQAAAETDRVLNSAASNLGEAREREQAARQELESATETAVAGFIAWQAALQQLTIADPDALIEAFRLWSERAEGSGPFQIAADAARQRSDRAVTEERTLVEMEARTLTARAQALAAEIERLESGVHLPPPPPHTRATARAERAGAALWQLCDFRTGVSAAIRAGVEAALEASGLLDAWVCPDGVVLDPGTQDTLLIVAPSAGPPDADAPAHLRLSEWLEPVTAAGGDGALPVSSETVRRILSAIGAAPDVGEYWVSADGAWQLGPLRGRWSKHEAEHIGEASRLAARRRQAAALRQELVLVSAEGEQLRVRLEDLDTRRATIAAEYERLPSDAGVREAGFALVHAAASVTIAIDRVQQAEEKSSAARQAVEHARQRRNADAADTQLTGWVERLDELRDAFGGYREALSAVWPHLQRAADAAVQRQRAAARVAAAHATHQERAVRQRQTEMAAHEAESRYQALHATVGASADAILLQHGATVQRLEETRQLAKSLAAQERERDLQRERAAADIDRHSADHARHESERRAAVDRLAAFALRRLLGEADSAFGTLDTSGDWSPTRGVDVARRVESVLADTPSDDDAWRRHQESIHQHITTLRDQLIPRGHHPEEHLLEDVVVVQCPFQGGLCTMTELAAILSDDLAARTRLLDEKEREVIENHLLGEVVLELQNLVLEAEKWVGATNQQLANRPTSTGMLLRFQWEPDPDGPDGLDSVRRQLLRTRELWTPDERRGLAEFLQARIREARDADATGTWRDYLSTALDYRKWHRFAVERYQDGQWRRLTRRTYGTGSGGEKALALTLPQFAAAAAHYQSADPAAPRLILLDEVFVGIDSEMRANCMGLLESFDLDFIMTSEREWGCYPTLSGLGIYQLSSRAGIDAVACTRWVWNGHERQRAAVQPLRVVPRSRGAAESLSLPFDAPPHESTT